MLSQSSACKQSCDLQALQTQEDKHCETFLEFIFVCLVTSRFPFYLPVAWNELGIEM